MIELSRDFHGALTVFPCIWKKETKKPPPPHPTLCQQEICLVCVGINKNELFVSSSEKRATSHNPPPLYPPSEINPSTRVSRRRPAFFFLRAAPLPLSFTPLSIFPLPPGLGAAAGRRAPTCCSSKGEGGTHRPGPPFFLSFLFFFSFFLSSCFIVSRCDEEWCSLRSHMSPRLVLTRRFTSFRARQVALWPSLFSPPLFLWETGGGRSSSSFMRPHM